MGFGWMVLMRGFGHFYSYFWCLIFQKNQQKQIFLVLLFSITCFPCLLTIKPFMWWFINTNSIFYCRFSIRWWFHELSSMSILLRIWYIKCRFAKIYWISSSWFHLVSRKIPLSKISNNIPRIVSCPNFSKFFYNDYLEFQIHNHHCTPNSFEG